MRNENTKSKLLIDGFVSVDVSVKFPGKVTESKSHRKTFS